MARDWKRGLALALCALIMLPHTAFAVEPKGEGTGQLGVQFVTVSSNATVTPNELTIKSNEKHTFDVTLAQGKLLESIDIAIESQSEDDPGTMEPGTITLSKDKLTETMGAVTVSMNAWPEYTKKFQLTVETAALDAAYAAEVMFKTDVEPASYAAEVTVSGSATVNGQEDGAPRGSEVSVSIVPDEGYKLSSLSIQYGDFSETLQGGNASWNGFNITWNAQGETTISGEIYADLIIAAVTEEVPVEYRLTVEVDDGLRLRRPSNRVTDVLEGSTYEVRVEAEPGYVISDLTVNYGRSYASWATGQSFFSMGNDRVQVHEKSDEVWFILPEIYADTNVYFTSDYDQENIPVEIDEGSRINIDASCGETVSRGDDAEFYISTTSDRYSVQKVTLTVGDRTGSASPGDGEIRVGNKNYEIDDVGNGEYVLYVDNITEPVTVAATSSASSYVSRPTLSISSSSHMSITKSVSSSQIYAGDDVTFYFTPDTNYQIDEITVRIGSNSRTVGATSSSIRVGSKTYQMSRSSSGVVSVYLTDIEENVKVSGRAYYTTSPVEPTDSIRLNTSSRSAFMNGYSDGTFRPENNMTRAEAVVMLYRMSTVSTGSSSTSSIFGDVPLSLWCAKEINAFARAGIVDRTNYFYPDQAVTRAELTEWIYRLMGSPYVSSSAVRFSDISGVSNSDAIRYAASKGWVNGYSDGTFRPYAPIARSEVAAMMTRVLNRTSGGYGTYYKDVPSTYWAYRYIQLASSYI